MPIAIIEDKHTDAPKINLFLLTFLSLISGGIYFPIWYLRRHSFLGYDLQQYKYLFLNKWLFAIAALLLGGAMILGGWYEGNYKLVQNDLKKQSLENIRAGRDILTEDKSNPGLFEKTFELKTRINQTSTALGIVGLFLIIQSFFARAILNLHLGDIKQKKISIWAWVISGIFFYVFFAVLSGNTWIGLLWANFPLIFILQYKINYL